MQSSRKSVINHGDYFESRMCALQGATRSPSALRWMRLCREIYDCAFRRGDALELGELAPPGACAGGREPRVRCLVVVRGGERWLGLGVLLFWCGKPSIQLSFLLASGAGDVHQREHCAV